MAYLCEKHPEIKKIHISFTTEKTASSCPEELAELNLGGSNTMRGAYPQVTKLDLSLGEKRARKMHSKYLKTCVKGKKVACVCSLGIDVLTYIVK